MTKEELRDMRLTRKLTQAQFAKLIGYSEGHVRNMESGRAEITERFEKIVRSALREKKLKKNTKNP